MIKTILNDFTENTYIINEKLEAYIIDPGTNYRDTVKYVLESNFKVLGILLTHGHFDHIVGVNKLIKEFNCPVHIHELERDFLFDPNLNLSGLTYNRFLVTKKEMVQTFTEESIFTLGREQIKITHTPGHTRGGVCYKYKNFLFSGDTLFKGSIGRTDLPTSNGVEIQRSVAKIIKTNRDNTIVYPGHGQFTTILNEKRDNPFIRV